MKTDAERDKLYARMTEIIAAYAPIGGGIYRIENTLAQPWIKGYKKAVSGRSRGVSSTSIAPASSPPNDAAQ